jgi:hypothetical protein
MDTRHYDHLSRTPAGESEPAVKRGGTLLAAAAGTDADGGCGSLDDIPEANVFLVDESRQARPISLVLTLSLSIIPCLLVHCIHLL